MLFKENIGGEEVIFDTLLEGSFSLFFHIKTHKTPTAGLSSFLGKQPPTLIQRVPILSSLQQAAFPPRPAPPRAERQEEPHHHPAFLLHLLLRLLWQDTGQQAMALLLGETGKRKKGETLQPRKKSKFTSKDQQLIPNTLHMPQPFSIPTTLCHLLATWAPHKAGKTERRLLNKCSFFISPVQLIYEGHRYSQVFLKAAHGKPLGPVEHLVGRQVL